MQHHQHTHDINALPNKIHQNCFVFAYANLYLRVVAIFVPLHCMFTTQGCVSQKHHNPKQIVDPLQPMETTINLFKVFEKRSPDQLSVLQHSISSPSPVQIPKHTFMFFVFSSSHLDLDSAQWYREFHTTLMQNRSLITPKESIFTLYESVRP